MSPRARISQLEAQVRWLSTAVQKLNGKVGVETSAEEAAMMPPPAGASSGFQHESQPDEDPELEEEEEAESPQSPPPHLMQLLSNSVLGADGHTTPVQTPSSARHAPHSQSRGLAMAALRKLMPPREDMLVLASLADSWLKVYDSMFPMIKTLKSTEEMMAVYDRLQADHEPHQDSPREEWDPLLSSAALLLTLAITVQLVPPESHEPRLKSVLDGVSFVKQAADTVERFVVADDVLAGTLEGIEVVMLYLRM